AGDAHPPGQAQAGRDHLDGDGHCLRVWLRRRGAVLAAVQGSDRNDAGKLSRVHGDFAARRVSRAVAHKGSSTNIQSPTPAPHIPSSAPASPRPTKGAEGNTSHSG